MITFLILFGAACGAAITACVASIILRSAERFWNGRLDYWANRCSEMQEQLNELEQKRDGADWWKEQ